MNAHERRGNTAGVEPQGDLRRLFQRRRSTPTGLGWLATGLLQTFNPYGVVAFLTEGLATSAKGPTGQGNQETKIVR